RSAPQTGPALTGKTDAGSGLDPGRDVDAERPVLADPSSPGAARAGILDDLPAAGTGRTGALDGEEALLCPHLAHAGTGGTGNRLRASLGAGAAADIAGDRGWHGDRRLPPPVGFLERHPQVVAEVGAPAGTLAAPGPCPHEIAKEIVEDIRERACEIMRVRRAAMESATILEGRVTETVIGGLPLGILQGVVGLVDLLELTLRGGVVLVAVGMQRLRLLAIGLLDLVLRRVPADAEHVVIVTFCHGRRASSKSRDGPSSPEQAISRLHRDQRFLLSSPMSSKSASTTPSSSAGREPASPVLPASADCCCSASAL